MIKNNRTSLTNVIRCFALLSSLVSSQVQAAITLTISGVYDTTNTILFDAANPNGTPSGASVFGLTGANNPIAISFTFKDTATPIILTSGTVATANGSGVSGALTRNWYGYLASDIESISTSIAGHSWAPSGLSDAELSADGTGAGSLANIWFDQDVTFATPTRAIFDLDNARPNYLGVDKGFIIADSSATSGIDTPAIRIGQYQSDTFSDIAVETPSTSFTITSTVPEPSKALFLMLGIATLKLRRKRL